ncbi:MAG: TRCF domain-containing protein, partial [bacterium]
GQKEEEEDIPATNIKLDGYIPESYVDSDIEKLELYTRIYKANKLSTLDQVTEEMKDMYGQLPHEINNIIMKRRFDILSHDPIFESVKDAPEGIIMTFTADYAAHVDGISFFNLAHRFIKDPKPNLSFAHSHITVTVYNSDHYIQNAISFMEAVIKEAHNG